MNLSLVRIDVVYDITQKLEFLFFTSEAYLNGCAIGLHKVQTSFSEANKFYLIFSRFGLHI
jgi:hypothetical protein